MKQNHREGEMELEQVSTQEFLNTFPSPQLPRGIKNGEFVGYLLFSILETGEKIAIPPPPPPPPPPR